MLIDSNILIYSINSSSLKHKKAQKFLQDNKSDLQIAHQNILEALRVLTHKKFSHPMKTKDAFEALERIIVACEIIIPDYKTFRISLELIKKYKLTSNQVFDAYLAATAISNDITEIATDNIKDFRKIKEIKAVNPFKTTPN